MSAARKAIGEDIESTANLIGRKTQTPQEVQYVIGELSGASQLNDVKEALRRISLGATERLRLYCRASTDGERLFLFLIMTTLQGEEHNDFARVYTALYRSLELAGDSRSADYKARAKYWPLFYQIVYPENRQPFFKRGIHLKAIHSSVREAAKQEIGKNGDGFLDRMTAIVNDRSLRIHERKMVACHLVHEHSILTEDSIQLLAAALPELVEPSYTLAFGSVIGAVMSEWPQLPEVIRTAFFDIVRNGVPRLAAEVCEMFIYYPLPQEDTWRFYELLLAQTPLMGVGQITAIRHPWEYFVGNINLAPNSIVESFDRLASRDTSGFSFVLGKLAGGYWSQFRPAWKEAILSDQSAITRWNPTTAALRQIFYGLFSYDEKKPPAQLLEQLYENLTNAKPEFRAEAGIWTLIYWEHLPEKFHHRLRTLFKTEPEPAVLFEILHDGMGGQGDEHDIELASVAIERANDVMAACLLNVFASKSRSEQNTNLTDLIQRSKIKGGQYSRAVLLENVDLTAVQSEPDIVKLAIVWKAVTDSSSSKKANDENYERILELIEELSEEYQQLAYYIVAYHETELPQQFKKLVDSLLEKGDHETRETIAEARRDSEEGRTPDGRSLPGFPISSFGPKLN